jgi:hypothetical protein
MDVQRVSPAQVHAAVERVINPPPHVTAKKHHQRHKPIDAKCIS